MIRINRLIRKSTVYEVLQLPNVAKIELIRRKANQKDSNRVRVCIYLTRLGYKVKNILGGYESWLLVK